MANKPPPVSQLLKQHGLRPTAVRERIMDLLFFGCNHLSSEEIIDALRGRGYQASAATIYQNLARLADAGLLARFAAADGRTRYDANLGPHHHLICVQCGTVVDVQLSRGRLPSLVADERGNKEALSGWKLGGVQFEFKGVCPRCLKGP